MRWLLKGVKIINFMKSNQTPNFNPKDIIRNITQLTENGLKQSELASKGDDWHSVVDLLDESAHHFRKFILEVGGSLDFMQQYIKFRGGKPKIKGLLKASGITVNYS